MPGAILLVEDDLFSRRILARFLKAEGYVVADAENGTVAAKLIRRSIFDAIITDFHLGSGIDGFDVLTCFEKCFPGKGKILVSGTLTDVKARCASLGALFIKKPLQLDQLLVKLESLLARQPAKEELSAATMVVVDIYYEWRVKIRQRSLALRQRSENLQRRTQESNARYFRAEEKMRRLLSNSE